jgi:hypothetical protein
MNGFAYIYVEGDFGRMKDGGEFVLFGLDSVILKNNEREERWRWSLDKKVNTIIKRFTLYIVHTLQLGIRIHIMYRYISYIM